MTVAMEQYNNTPKTPILGRGGFGRVMKWIGSERPNPMANISTATMITVLVDLHPPYLVSTRSVRLTDLNAK